MIVAREQPGVAAEVDRLHDEAFGRSLEAEILRGLRADPSAWVPRLSLVLLDGDELLGHIVASRAVLRPPGVPDVPVLGAGPVAVRPSRQRQGLGTLLVPALAAAADAMDEPMLVLLGDPAFYGRHGFVLAAGLGVEPPVAQWVPHFQVRTLSAYDPAVHHGTFRYAAAFDLDR